MSDKSMLAYPLIHIIARTVAFGAGYKAPSKQGKSSKVKRLHVP